MAGRKKANLSGSGRGRGAGAGRGTASSAVRSFEWMTWAFVAERLASGALQALGGLLIYAGLVVWIVHSAMQSKLAETVLAMRLNSSLGAMTESGAVSSSSSPPSTG